ncbi:response regulator [Treponema zioleckii]|uniref:response regulator n=1 Tax=Treponema zioleckii TaxID=331680 RepID=UPI001F5BF640|nr:response regulator [Treponema zioleckii]
MREKLVAEKVGVEIANGQRDAFTKLISTIPDLIILNIEDNIEEFVDFLEKKKKDINAKNIPVIISGPVASKETVGNLIQYDVIKYFTKPIKFDVFFESIGQVLKLGLSMDTTPCVLDIHLNNNIIFIEIAMGLNREKIAILKYKLSELIEKNKIETPKVVLMMTDLNLSFVDGLNLELLFDNIISNKSIAHKNIKVLSLDEITKDMIEGHPEYDGIEVVRNLSDVLNSLVGNNNSEDLHDAISENFLTATKDANTGSVEMRFYSDSGAAADSDDGSTITARAAIIDDDVVIRELLKKSFENLGFEAETFSKGSEFILEATRKKFSVLILDIFMPGLSGFDILKSLQDRKIVIPTIIYSQAMQKEMIMQSLQLGAKSYLLKPQKPEVVTQKALEIINA